MKQSTASRKSEPICPSLIVQKKAREEEILEGSKELKVEKKGETKQIAPLFK